MLVVPDDEVARDEIDLFPIVVDERLRRIHAGREAEVACPVAALLFLVEKTREYLLMNALRVSRRRLPALAGVGLEKFLVFLVDSHLRTSIVVPPPGRPRARQES